MTNSDAYALIDLILLRIQLVQRPMIDDTPIVVTTFPDTVSRTVQNAIGGDPREAWHTGRRWLEGHYPNEGYLGSLLDWQSAPNETSAHCQAIFSDTAQQAATNRSIRRIVHELLPLDPVARALLASVLLQRLCLPGDGRQFAPHLEALFLKAAETKPI